MSASWKHQSVYIDTMTGLATSTINICNALYNSMDGTWTHSYWKRACVSRVHRAGGRNERLTEARKRCSYLALNLS